MFHRVLKAVAPENLTPSCPIDKFACFKFKGMPLFRDHPVRSCAAVAVALAVSHFLAKLTSSFHAFQLTQTSVTILAIISLMFLVITHHRRQGQLLTQTQEEMLLIGGFGLFWMAIFLAWRAWIARRMEVGMDLGRSAEVELASAGATTHQTAARRRLEPGFTGAIRPYPCSSDDVYCIVEEYTFF